jgi:hypothetical protein
LSLLALLLSEQRSESLELPKPPKPEESSGELLLELGFDERNSELAELVRPEVTPRPGAGRRFELLRLFELNMVLLV